MKRIFAIITFCALISLTGVYGQEGSGFLSIQYDMSFQTGDLGDYISKPSFRGASMQYRYFVTDNILVGADAGWNVFYERMEFGSYSAGTVTLSGVQWRTQNMIPLLVAADYMISPGSMVNPYVGLGIGTLYTERSTDMGTWRLKQDPWHFAIKPEVGILAELSPGTSAKIAAKYYTGFSAGDLETQSYFTLSIGFAFVLR